MANDLGAQGWIGFKKEVTPDTQEATVDKFFPTEAFKLNKNQEQIERKSTAGTLGRLPNLAGKASPNGKVDTELYASLPHPLYWILGGAVTTTQPDGAGNPTVYKHNFGLAAGIIALTAESYEVVDSKKQSGFRLNKLDLSCAAGEAVNLKFDGLSKTHTDGAVLTSIPNYPNDLLTFAGAKIAIAGADSTIIDNVSLSIDKTTEVKHVLNALVTPGSVRPKDIAKIEGKLSFIDYPAAEYNRLVSFNTFALVLTFEGDAISGAYKKYVRITLPACQYKPGGFEKEVKSEVYSGDADFLAAVDLATSKVIDVEIQNTLVNLN